MTQIIRKTPVSTLRQGAACAALTALLLPTLPLQAQDLIAAPPADSAPRTAPPRTTAPAAPPVKPPMVKPPTVQPPVAPPNVTKPNIVPPRVTPAAPSPVVAPVAPVLRELKVLVLALDGLNLAQPLVPLVAAQPEVTPPLPVVPPDAILPDIVAPDTVAPEDDEDKASTMVPVVPEALSPTPELPVTPEVPPITPSITPAEVTIPTVQWRAHAKKATAKEDERFNPEPLPPPSRNTTAGGRATGEAAVVSAPPGEGALSPALPATANRPDESLNPGPAFLTVPALRRELAQRGLREDNVLSLGLSSPAIQRVVNSKMVPEHVLTDLHAAIGRIVATQRVNALDATPINTENATASTETVQAAIRAASFIGQALNYRAVVVVAVTPSGLAPFAATEPALVGGAFAGASSGRSGAFAGASTGAAATTPQTAFCSLLIVDSLRDQGQSASFDAAGAGNGLYADAARTGAAIVADKLSSWPSAGAGERLLLVDRYMKAATDALKRGDDEPARDLLQRVLAMDPDRAEAYIMLADTMQSTDPVAAARIYRRALEVNDRDGAMWARLANTLTQGEQPDWSRALEAGRRALALRYETPELRLALAQAQYGRATLYRGNDQIDRAEDLEIAARQDLDRALELAGDDDVLALNATRLLARSLVEAGNYRQAAEALDRFVLQYPDDATLQELYATALTNAGNRDEDAFTAWARVWKLTGIAEKSLDPISYLTLANGFDKRVANLGMTGAQLATGVARGAVERTQALLLLQQVRDFLGEAEIAIKTVSPPPGRIGIAHFSRVLAVDLMRQSLENQQVFLETGQEDLYLRGLDLRRQSLNYLNQARLSAG